MIFVDSKRNLCVEILLALRHFEEVHAILSFQIERKGFFRYGVSKSQMVCPKTGQMWHSVFGSKCIRII